MNDNDLFSKIQSYIILSFQIKSFDSNEKKFVQVILFALQAFSYEFRLHLQIFINDYKI